MRQNRWGKSAKTVGQSGQNSEANRSKTLGQICKGQVLYSPSKSCGAPKKGQHLLAIICLHYQTLNEIIWLEISNVCFQELRGISIKV